MITFRGAKLSFVSWIFLQGIFCELLNAQVALPPAYPSSSRYNLTTIWEADAPLQDATSLNSQSTISVKQTTVYSDGFGRQIQIIKRKASPLGNDLVNAQIYDQATGREIYSYKPYSATGALSGDVADDGNFKLNAFQEQAGFYNSFLSGQTGDYSSGTLPNYSYEKTYYENSPLGRVAKKYPAGVNWVGSEGITDRSVRMDYLVNTISDNVQIWTITSTKASSSSLPETQIAPINQGSYPAGALFKKIVTDEQGLQTISFIDKSGQIVLEKKQNTASSDNGLGSGHSGWQCTYYVYDNYGNIRFIITPNVVQLIDGSWNSITPSLINDLCYYFEYDNQDRQVIKKSPGTPAGIAGEVWNVYDSRDRLVMTQDGNLRVLNKWRYYVYDGVDRVVSIGLLTDPNTNQSNYSNLNFHINSASSTANWPNITGYTIELLRQNFYDGYNWMGVGNSSSLTPGMDNTNSGAGNSVFSSSQNVSPNYLQPLVASSLTRGKLTGSKEEVLNSNQTQYLYSVLIYDDRSRVVQSKSINYGQGLDVQTVQYTWDGRPVNTVVSQSISASSNQSHIITTTLSYDQMKRPLTLSKSINSVVGGQSISASSQLLSYSYNELGDLNSKTLGNNLETLKYDYNVRGWVIGMNRSYLNNTSSNYFGYELGFDKTSSVITNTSGTFNSPTQKFNGLLNGAIWKGAGDAIARKYDYTYDNLGRLVSADFNQLNGSSFDRTAGIDFSVNSISYDGNGNIGSLSQKGYLITGSNTIDNLSYSYSNGRDLTTGANYSNILTSVTDASNDPNSALGDFHYPASKSLSIPDYDYDANGNFIKDNNRSASSIEYAANINMPTKVSVAGKGTVLFAYDAEGKILQKQIVEDVVTKNGYQSRLTTTFKYLDGFVYKSVLFDNVSLSSLNYTDRLQFVPHEAGRIRFKPSVGSVPASFVFDYYIKDQLDNVRVVLTDESSAQPDIYPAATLESSTYNGGVAQSLEGNYYNIKGSNVQSVITSPKLSPWWNNATNHTYLNNNSNPTNPDPYSDPVANSANVYWLNGQSGDKTGLGITLKVMAGDKISIFGKSVWHNTSTQVSYVPISSTLLDFFGAIAGSAAVTTTSHGSVTASSLTNNNSIASAVTSLLNSTPAPTGNTNLAPKASISWILFDDQFKPVSIGTNPTTTTSDLVYTHNFSLDIPLIKSGYLYVYCGNESNIDVFFDNLQVVLRHGPIVEENHYYPTGLLMAGISDKAFGKTANQYKYQSKEMQNQEWDDGTGLELYNFEARMYDAQLGLWHSQDPAGQFASPYLGMGNSWVNGKDPKGKAFFGLGYDDLLVSAFGFITGYLTYGMTKGNWGGKALLTGLGSAVLAEGSYLTLGGGSAAAASNVSGLSAGTAGSMTAAKDFTAAFVFSQASIYMSHHQQLHDASDWRAFGLIEAYSLSSALSAGFGSDYKGELIDKSAALKTDEDLFVWVSQKHAVSSGFGGFLSTLNESIFNSYDPVANKWNTKMGPILGKAFVEDGFIGAYLGQASVSSLGETNWVKDAVGTNFVKWLKKEAFPNVGGAAVEFIWRIIWKPTFGNY